MGLWRVEEAAEYLGIRPKTLYEWVRLDRVPYRKIGFNVRFDPDELERWTAKQSRGGGGQRTASHSGGSRKKKKAAPAGKRITEGPPGPAPVDNERLGRLASEASTLLRELERDVGTSLSFPQRRKLIELANRLDSAASKVSEP